MTDIAARAWVALSGTDGIGPKTLARVARSLADRDLALVDVMHPDQRETAAALSELGLRERLAEAAAQKLAQPVSSLDLREGVSVLHPDAEGFPTFLCLSS